MKLALTLLALFTSAAFAGLPAQDPGAGQTAPASPAPTPKLVARVEHEGWVSSVAFSPDGRRLATASFMDGTVRVWDVATRRQIRVLSGARFWAVSFSPDGRMLAATVMRGATTLLIDIAEWKRVRTFGRGSSDDGHQRGSNAFSPDGKLLLVANTDGARLWDVASGELVRHIPAGGEVSSVAFSPDGRRLAYAVREMDTAGVVEVATGAEVLRIEQGLFFATAVAFSPDGKSLLVGSHAGTRVWDIATGERKHSFMEGIVEAAVFTPDGRHVILAGIGTEKKEGVTLWDAATAEPVLRFADSPKSYAVAISRDGCLVAGGGQSEREDRRSVVAVWNICGDAARKPARSPTAPAPRRAAPDRPELVVQLGNATFVNLIAFSPDGSLVATGASQSVVLWQAATGRVLRRLHDFPGSLKAMYISGGGSLLLTVHASSAGVEAPDTLRVWDVATGEEVGRTGELPVRLKTAAVSPDDRLVMAEDERGLVRIFEARGGKEVKSFRRESDEAAAELKGWRPYGKLESASGVSVSADGRRRAELTHISHSSFVLIKDLKTGKEVNISATDYIGDVHSILFSPDGKHLLGGGTGAGLWDAETGQPLRKFVSLGGPVFSASFSPDGRTILTAGLHTETFPVVLWDVGRGAERLRVNEPENGFFVGGKSRFTAALSADRATLVTGTTVGEVRLRSAETGALLRRLSRKPNDLLALTSVSLSPDGRSVLTGQLAGARLWDRASGRLLREFKGHALVTSAVFSPDGKLVATTSNDQNVVVWDALTGKPRALLEPHDSWVLCAAFSTDGRRVATGTLDGKVSLWDVESREFERDFQGDMSITSVRISPDGNFVLAGDAAGSALLWDARTGELVRRFAGHTGSVNSVDFSPAGDLVLTGSEDGTTRLWRTATGDEVCSLASLADGAWVVATPDGRFDTNDLERARGLHWLMRDDPLNPQPVEIFMRDYYEPRLLTRLLDAVPDAEQFMPVRPLASLNRAQPLVKIIGLEQQAGRPDKARVSVEVGAAPERLLKRDARQPRQSDAYDLRLFRDGQLVGYTAPATLGGWGEDELAGWRAATRVTAGTGGEAGNGRCSQGEAGKVVCSFEVSLPSGAGDRPLEFSAYAFNEDRVKSETDRATLRAQVSPPASKPKAYVVSVGVNAYDNPAFIDLNFAAADARAFQRTVAGRLRAGGAYEVAPVALLSEAGGGGRAGGATKANVKAVLDALAGRGSASKSLAGVTGAEGLRRAAPDDLVLLTFSGHGYADRRGNFYLVPQGTSEDGSRRTAAEVAGSLISSEELGLWLREVDAGEIAIIIDACHSAAGVEAGGFRPGPLGSRGLGQLAYDKGMTILAATQAADRAFEIGGAVSQGLLSYTLVVEGLERGRADFKPQPDGRVTLREWLEFGAAEAPRLHQRLAGGEAPAAGRDAGAEGDAQGLGQRPSLFDFARGRRDTVLSVGRAARPRRAPPQGRAARAAGRRR